MIADPIDAGRLPSRDSPPHDGLADHKRHISTRSVDPYILWPAATPDRSRSQAIEWLRIMARGHQERGIWHESNGV
jgi:hypothetical protein